MSSRQRLILGLFVLSGAAGLVYEVVWSRQLVLVFGNTTQAISAILTGFFGGMAIGSWLGGRFADRVRRPLWLYGLLELGLVAVVLVTPATFRVLDLVFGGAYPTLETAPQLLALVRFALALLALGPATILLGATLPTLTRYLARDSASELSGSFSRLYAANTIGAIVGTVAAGFVLIELLGLTGALWFGAACSATAGSLALLIDHRQRKAGSVPPAVATRPSGEPKPTGRWLALPLALAFLSGLTSLAYQVLWTRLVAAGTGNSTYVFTMILAVFLLGIALGATLFARLRPRLRDPIGLIAFGQAGAALFVIAGMVLIIDRHVVPPLGPTTPLMEVFSTFVVATIIVVLPATTLLGLTFPATSALVQDADHRVASDAGLLLAVNTAGAICGTFILPFFVIPAVGSPTAIALVAGTSAAIGVVLAIGASRFGGRPRPATALLGAAALGIAVLGTASGRLFLDPTVAAVDASGGHVYARAEDEIAPVVSGEIDGSKQLWVMGSSMTGLTVDTRVMPVLPLAMRPDSQRALVIAFGMGATYRSALIDGLQADAVELVPSVPKMFHYYFADAATYLADPEGRVVIADGRNYVALTDRRYDIVIVDPPPPVESSGVSVISSLEFYRAAHVRLTPGGVMVQWVPYGQTVDGYRSQVATFRAVFPHVIVSFSLGDNGTYMIGSDQPIALRSAAIRSVVTRPGVLADLGSAVDSPALGVDGWVSQLSSLPWIEGDAVAAFAGDAPLITDDHPLPEYFLLRDLFGPHSPQVSRAALVAATPQTVARSP